MDVLYLNFHSNFIKTKVFFNEKFQTVLFALSSGGVTVEEDVVLFDGYDLVGNVGGYLGLTLGASILSIYDALAAAAARRRAFLASRVV